MKHHSHLRLRTLCGLLFAVGLSLGNAAEFYSARPTQRVADWQQRMDDISHDLAHSPHAASARLVFLGDSITHYWLQADNPWIPNQRGGRAIWDAHFGQPGTTNYALNHGVTGDRTEHLLHRLLPRSAGGRGEFDRADLQPEFIVLLIGINNTWNAEEPVPDSVFAGIKAVITSAEALKPQARIIIQSLLPTNDPQRNNHVVAVVNQRIKEFVGNSGHKNRIFLNLYSSYIDDNGIQRSELFCDSLHLNEAGYRVWAERLLDCLATARGAR